MSEQRIHVIGAGLAGCEAAWQAANMGVQVVLHEMKPQKKTPAHHSALFAELCCSNSLRSEMPENAVGLLKAEMQRLNSLIMEAAMATRVPAGSALAVDRDAFASYITEKISTHPGITVIAEECARPVEGEITIIATGPLTSQPMAEYIKELVGGEQLHFFDAAAPIVDAASIDMNKAFIASRYGKGEACYINCPMTKEEYDVFYEALISAEEAALHDFDKESQKELTVFEGCMPVEVMAKRGYETLLYGPMKPVGLPLPDTGKEAFAVLQLRQENLEKTMYNLVGFQTHLTFPEQRRVFRLIPGLEQAEFIRYGVMHRNTFLNSPLILDETYRMKNDPNVYFAGQMTGVEGYVESAGSGLVAGISAARQALGLEKLIFSPECELGAMARYVAYGSLGAFQPMNANFGIIEPLGRKVKGGKQARNKEYALRALQYVEQFKEQLLIDCSTPEKG
ncbi:MAG: methylenetetrahydrofolate--tRNA-(uracil(54)-C(5))-methyltransferase (FADH(2)-oxidizing) TrmFO [Clostridia bacterium]|nr:methylenetetrahydrofolate--tRNA-(uracil(54)-C(5))-methyltransferase (FADH(2)-oxidizing) TrmFO [Clostridia bacterium]